MTDFSTQQPRTPAEHKTSLPGESPTPRSSPPRAAPARTLCLGADPAVPHLQQCLAQRCCRATSCGKRYASCTETLGFQGTLTCGGCQKHASRELRSCRGGVGSSQSQSELRQLREVFNSSSLKHSSVRSMPRATRRHLEA